MQFNLLRKRISRLSAACLTDVGYRPTLGISTQMNLSSHDH